MRPEVAALLLAAGAACASEASYIEQGQKLALQKNYDAAIEQFMLAIGENPDSQGANLNLGLVYLEIGRVEDAEKAIEQSRKKGDSEEALVALAMIAHGKKDYRQAASLMESALKLAPNKALNHLRLGLIRKQGGDLERAAESFRMAMAQDPEMVDARVNLGLTLKQLQRHDEALEVLKDAVKDLRGAGSSVTAVQAALGEVYESQQMLDYAIHSYKLALRTDPKNVTALAGIGRVLRAQLKYEEAIEVLGGAVVTLPKEPRIFLQLGLAYRDFHLEPQAIEALTKAIELDPPQDEAYVPLLGLMERSKAPADKVAKVLAAASAALPNDLALQLRAGEICLDRGDFPKAIEAFKRALEIEPANIDANHKLGLAYARAANFEAATQTYDILKYLDAAKAEDLKQTIEKETAKAAAAASDDDKKSGKKKRPPKGKRGKKR
ncbi:MAG: tetratricopeptide repeat protein [Deltaproteobacteria bacterium]|nr:tetratricopeptide repeat protein [Deltaproteobacteria bacterium]